MCAASFGRAARTGTLPFASVPAVPPFIFVGVEVTRLIIFFAIRMRLLTSSPTSFSRCTTPPVRPKHQRAGALQDAARNSNAVVPRASVLDCDGPPPLFPKTACRELHELTRIQFAKIRAIRVKIFFSITCLLSIHRASRPPLSTGAALPPSSPSPSRRAFSR